MGRYMTVYYFLFQVCTLVKCTSLETCYVATDTAYTKFEWFSLAGTFQSTIVYPEVLLSGVQLDPKMFQVMDYLFSEHVSV